MYGLVGEKLGHSYSKMIHESLGKYTFDMIELSKEELDVFLKEKKFSAINVTIPYKQTVISYLDILDDSALKIGAVNTIVNRDGKLFGYNTDYYGFRYLLEYKKIVIKDKKVVVLGIGGASKAVSAVVRDLGAKEIVFVHPTKAVSYEMCYQLHHDAQVIVNATPVGMYPNANVSPIDVTQFHQLEAVAEVIYNPFRTKLIMDAKKVGAKTAGGLLMLGAQAKQAIEIFTDKILPDTCILDMAQRIMNEKQNIVLIGMPGCGKTTIAKQLAEELEYTLVDIDEEIEKEQGCLIRDIFAKYGESYFRDLETKCTCKYAKENHQVIACGGGVIKREENMEALLQNGVILYVQRDLELLSVNDGRPLSVNKEAIYALYNERKALYELYSDEWIWNNGSIDDAVSAIKKILGGNRV